MLWGCSELQVDLKNWLELERWDYDDDDDELERWDYDAGGVCPVSAETSLSDTAWGTEPAWQLWRASWKDKWTTPRPADRIYRRKAYDPKETELTVSDCFNVP